MESFIPADDFAPPSLKRQPIRAAAIGQDVAELEATGLAGSPAQVVDKLGRFAAAGASRMYLQVLDLHDLDHLELIAAEIMPQVR